MQPRHLAVLLFAAAVLANLLGAQCAPQWLTGEPRLVPAGRVDASVYWDPDGAGPAPLRLAVGGSLTAADAPHTAVATWDGAQWVALGNLTGSATALAVHNGQLHASTVTTTIVAGFPFTTYAVQVWDGTAWQSIGVVSSFVNTMTSYNGQLVIGGFFSSVGGVGAANVASWNGTNWAPLGSGVQGSVNAFALLNGSLWVGGAISSAGGTTVGNLAIWNGTTWLAAPSFNNTIETMVVRSSIAVTSTFLYVGGAFTSYTIGTTTTPALRIARFDSFNQTWSGVSGGLPGTRCTALAVRAIGLSGFELAAGVEDSGSSQRVWRLASGVWSSLGSLTDNATNIWPTSLAYFSGRWTAGISDSPTAVRTFDGSFWQGAAGRGIAGTVYTIEPAGNDLVIGGTFPTISGVTVNNIARGSPGAWTPLGTGIEGGLGVFALATAANGDIVATGDFTTAGGVPCNRIARWNGTAWSPLGAGLNASGYAVLGLPNGDIVAAGDFTTAGGLAATRIARWNGAAWTPLGSGTTARVNAMARLPNGDLVAGGNFLTAGGVGCNRIARWNGSVWSPLGTGCNGSVFALATAPNGDLFAAGNFTTAGGLGTRIGKWSNGAWSSLISLGIVADVMSLAVHPNGDLFIGGGVFSFSLGPFGGWHSNVVRITASGTLSPLNVQGTAVFDASIAQGEVVIGGLFDTAGGLASANVARFDAPCPATATAFGATCAGLGAPFALTTIDAPWLGGSWRLRAATFGPNSFALRAIGFSAFPGPIPLPPILPGSLPGCFGHVPADVAEVHLPSLGAVVVTTAVPASSSLVGVALFEQMLQFEAAGSGFAISASNGVHLVIGSY